MITRHDDGTRAIEVTVRIEADSQAVWKAITHPEEIERWFPLRARGEAREGGLIEVSWGDEGWWGSTLTLPEEGRHARFVDESSVEHGGPVLYMDYHLETDGGATVVRFVHSGFGPEDRWDDYLDALDAGWSYFFRNLKVYLEHHAGTPRTMLHDRPATRGSRGEIFTTLLEAVGLEGGELDGAAVGDSVALTLAGEPADGVLEARAPNRTMGFRLPGLEQSLLFLEIESAGDTGKVGVWLSTYGASPSTRDRLERTRDAVSAAVGAR